MYRASNDSSDIHTSSGSAVLFWAVAATEEVVSVKKLEVGVVAPVIAAAGAYAACCRLNMQHSWQCSMINCSSCDSC